MADKNQNSIAAFGLYQTVPAETREAMAKAVEETDLASYEGVAKSAQFILANLLRGDLPVDICHEAREVLQVQLLAIAAKDRAEGHGGLSGGAVVLMQMVNQGMSAKQIPEMIPAYSTEIQDIPETPTVIDLEEQSVFDFQRTSAVSE